MIEVNLLPWRQIAAKKQQDELKIFIVLSIILIFVFIMAHIFLSQQNKKIMAEMATLENKLMTHSAKTHNETASQLDHTYMNQAKFSQQQFQQMLNFLECFGENHLTISHVYFQANEMDMIGQVSSTFTVLKSLEMCRKNQAGFTVRKTIFTPIKQSDLLQFHLVIS